MFNTFAIISALALTSAVSASPSRLVKSRQIDQPITFENFSYEGEGCPAGSITTGALDFENFQFDVFYSDLVASIGMCCSAGVIHVRPLIVTPGPNGPKENTKCQLQLEFSTTTPQQMVIFGYGI